MKIEEIDKLVIIKAENSSFSDLSKALHQEITNGKGKNKNVIVDLLSLTDLNLSEIVSFQDLSDMHTASKCSFVLVNDSVSYNDLPQNLHVTPTLQEAKDLVEMEEIERDLGF